jgi:hypothetical protein
MCLHPNKQALWLVAQPRPALKPLLTQQYGTTKYGIGGCMTVTVTVKHNGAVLPLSSAPGGRGADGVDDMA